MGKRAFDLSIVIISSPVWLFLLAGVGLLVRLKLGPPVFFRQERPGLNGHIFRIWKFRTMTDERNARGELIPDVNRLPQFGRWLRSTSLDELPELINVLWGEMSLVGPRPLRAEYLSRYNSRQARRHEVLPGITGLAQVNGRNAISWEERFEWDLRYIETRSVALDLKVLALTIRSVFRRTGISAAGEATMPEFLPARNSLTHQPEEDSSHV